MAAPVLDASIAQKLMDDTDEAIKFTRVERELLEGMSHIVSITAKYGRKTLRFSVIRVGLTRDFIINEIVTPWNLEEIEFDLFKDKEGIVRLSDEYLCLHSNPIVVAYVKAEQIWF